ncbi:HAD-IC family P-type ATPase [Candidatus Phytoplasma mali]|uniref:HAD-IC family P-type ATPase n=1 Tax=Apple proliferation phytoplasma TaxID=37692 RepID=UPI0002EF4A32|nr:HAD-IC family P-type ATPase [Candidatus Phytoplasma mali]
MKKNKKTNINNINENNLKNKIFSQFYGLNNKEIEERKKSGKVNIITQKVQKTALSIILSNFFSFLNLLVFLIACFLIYLKRYEQLFFLFTNTTNVLIGIFHELRAKYTLDKISLLISNKSKVIRNGKLIEINASEIVIDDILYIETGYQILVDAKVKDGFIEVDESFLTGESNLVSKKKDDFLFSGSYVFSGQACAEVKEIGNNTYIQKISKEAKKYLKIQTPLMRNLSFFVKVILIIIFPMAITMYLTFPHESMYNTLNLYYLGLFGMIIGMMPTGIFLLISLSLTISCLKLVKNNVYVQDFFAIEMLSQINILCLDKTGTITDGKMNVKKVLKINQLHNISLEQIISQMLPTKQDLNFTSDVLRKSFVTSQSDFLPYKKIDSLSFSSIRKYSAIEFEQLGTFFLGSPEFILKKDFNIIQKEVDEYSSLGYRVILLAKNNFSLKENEKTFCEKEPLYLIIIEDNIKKNIISTINYFKQNDVAIKIISGDNYLTVASIGKRLGIIENNQEAISLENLTDKEVSDLALKYKVFGRTSPKQKKILIESFKKQNYKVAMTGDGVNDVLAFKVSDISIAMGSGSQVTRNLANIVLMDSQFNSIPNIVSEGRTVINNLEKVSILFFSKTISSFLLGLTVVISNLFLFSYMKKLIFPIDPLQLNLLDFFSIGIPSFFLMFENNNKVVKDDKFLIKVLKKAFPFSFLIFLNYVFLLIYFSNDGSDNSQTQIIVSNCLVLIVTFVLFFLLFCKCYPFNKWKKTLFIFMIIFFVITFYLLNLKEIINFVIFTPEFLKNTLHLFSFYFLFFNFFVICMFFLIKRFVKKY